MSADFVSLSTVNVTVEFDGLRALEDVNLTLAQGEILGLLGPNGAGKTTLVNVITGFSRPTSGEVLLDKERITGVRSNARARLGVVRTFQSVRLFPKLTVHENVRVAALSAKRGSGPTVDEALDFVGIGHQAGQLAGSLPYAQERLVGIARALATNPGFLLLDEPAAGMNDQEGQQLADLICRIPKRFGCGVLLIEHNMPVVMKACERLHVLRGGKTLAVGPKDEVRNNREVIDSYLGGH